MKLKEIIEELNLFERVPNDIRILGIATYIQTTSTRRTAKILLELHSVTAVWKWVKKKSYQFRLRRRKGILLR